MEITEKQLQQIASSICVLDVKAYIEQHRLEYEKFLEDEKRNGK